MRNRIVLVITLGVSHKAAPQTDSVVGFSLYLVSCSMFLCRGLNVIVQYFISFFVGQKE